VKSRELTLKRKRQDSTLEKPRLIIVAGPNGSGKTTITEKLLRHEWMDGCEYINPDFIARDELGDWTTRESFIKAANIAEERRNKFLAEGKSIAFETVFSSREKLEFVQKAKDAGYFIRLFFICTQDPTINAQRVAVRVMEGGHDVPISKIIDRYYKSIDQCIKVLPLLGRLYVYDNSAMDCDPARLFKIRNGIEAKKYSSNIPEWAQTILDSIH
jgi:predicted ABC-type ATPase